MPSSATTRLFFAAIMATAASTSSAFTTSPSYTHQPSSTISRSALLSTTTTTETPDLPTSKQCYLDGKKIRGPITPLGNFVLVRTKDTLDATDGGILLPDQAKDRPTEGEVVAAGPGKLHPHTGVRITNPVTIGDSVLFGKFDGHDMNYNEEPVTMIRDDDILLYYKGVRMTLANVIPCRDYVLVALEKQKTETSSGIVVAETVMRDYQPCEGKVAKVGEGRMTSTGEFSQPPVKEGDRVKFKDSAGNEVKIEGKEYSLVRMVDILSALPV